MGHGAPKRIDAIPIALVVNVYTAEGLLYDATRNLGVVLKSCLEGSEDPKEWEDLDTYREKVYGYTRQYNQAIQALIRHQGKG